MGNEGSLPVDGVAFDAEEIKRLGKRFKKLVKKYLNMVDAKSQKKYLLNDPNKKDLDGSGSLSTEEFMSLPELQQNPLVRFLFCNFDLNPRTAQESDRYI